MINLGKPEFDQEEIDAVAEVIRSGWVGRGKNVEEFEKEFALYSGARYAIAVNSCTVALYLSLKQRGIGAGDEVIVPSMTWNATAAVVVALGATPVFADIVPNTWCLDPEDVRKRITPKTKAVVPVHYGGLFAAGFENFEIPVIYDSAHRISKNDFTGTTSVYSFYVTKNITTVRGGMILTNDEVEYKWLRRARTSGIDQDVLKRYQDGDYHYEVEDPSWNFDMSDIEAAIGRVQMKKIGKFISRRNEIVKRYNAAFNLNNQGNHLYTILVSNRDEFMKSMRADGIQCGVHYFALHLMKGYKKYCDYSLPVTEFYSEHNVSLPIFSSLSDEDLAHVIDSVLKFSKPIKYTRPRITVGISAHNEEKNIKNVLMDVLRQKGSGWDLDRVWVYCDGCTDNTASMAREIESDLIEVVDDQQRLGKIRRIKQLFHDATGDITVIFDADIKFKDEYVIDKLIHAMTGDPVALVGGNTRPFPPKTFIERAVYSTFRVFDDSRSMTKNGSNIFGCNGACMAVKTSFAKSLQFADLANDDDFLYFSCLKKGYEFKHVPDAVVYYKLPTQIGDYLRQTFRSNPEAVVNNFKDHFGDLVAEEYHRPIRPYLQSVLKAIAADPVPAIFIIGISLISKPFFPIVSKNHKLAWDTAKSTKSL